MDLLERMRRTDLDNWVHFDERELVRGELPWGRSYTARAVAEARLSTGDQWRKWEASSGIPLTAGIDLVKLMEEIDAHEVFARETNFNSQELDEFLDKM